MYIMILPHNEFLRIILYMWMAPLKKHETPQVENLK